MTTSSSVARTLASWQSAGPEPLPGRLASALERAVLEGRIAPQTRLPSERDLALALGVSRSTVSGAYGLLRAGGWLMTRQGSGSMARLPVEFRDGLVPTDASHPDGAIDLRRAAPAAQISAYREAMSAAMDAITPELTNSVSSQGVALLRERIAQRHTRRGVPTGPENILVTSGAVPALWVVFAALFARAPAVIAESPTYPLALEAARQRRARLIGWPVLDGWDLDDFERLARVHAATAAYLLPDFQNPTGQLMPATLRADLVARAERLGVLLLVDETMAEIDLREDAAAVAPVAGPHVVTLGSMSKTVWDGLRVGWVRAEPEIIDRLAQHPLASQVATPPLEQAIAAALLPRLDDLVAVRRRALRVRRDHLVGALERLDGIGVERPPAGGLSVWATLERRSSGRLAIAALERGVLMYPGGRFSVAGGLDRNVRLPYTLPVPLLDTALERLAPLL